MFENIIVNDNTTNFYPVILTVIYISIMTIVWK